MRILAALLVCLALPAGAEVALDLPVGSVETARVLDDPGRYRLPTGQYTIDRQPAKVLEGRVLTRAWRTPPETSDTLSLLQLIRPQLAQAGYETIFECETAGCGGFDFRFNTTVLPPPQMQFDLTDFRALTARRGTNAPEYLSLLISRSARGGFIQAIDVAPGGARDIPLAPPERPAPPEAAAADTPGAVMTQLTNAGRLILPKVRFPEGSQTLDEEAVLSLQPLADALSANPGTGIVLVGHTDNAGTLTANIALSRSRAEAVRRVLVERYGIDAARIEAEGAGYLVPLRPNTNDENRAANRRVEAILR
ncbi:OmpA family protein [Oceanibium sediminis]|uniref:OmpA family protein n=1 Tax=Oceanibium sediminis TaxID=2026339 RepID=UPI000DD49E22|nr:OmpA family protein [Oceanibium sediminis]